MLNKEILNIICENINNKDIFNNIFLTKLTEELRKTEYFEKMSDIKFSDTSLFVAGSTLYNEVTLHPKNIRIAYEQEKKDFSIIKDTLFTKNIYKLFILLHELTHVYQNNIDNGPIKDLYLESIKIKEGFVLMNDFIDRTIVKICNRLNLNIITEYIALTKSYTFYKNNFHLFPSERMAEGYAYKYLVILYHVLGEEYFKDFNNFLYNIIYLITKDYYEVNGEIITPFNRFNNALNKYNYKITDIDINKINEYDRLLIGLESEIDVIKKVINTKILRK